MIVIIDYNVGNLKSVTGAFKRIGLEAVVSRDEKVIREAKGIVLPGVGTFPTAMKNLERFHLVELLKERKEAGIPILGICLGMQIIFEKGYEVEETKGLGFIPARGKRCCGCRAEICSQRQSCGETGTGCGRRCLSTTIISGSGTGNSQESNRNR